MNKKLHIVSFDVPFPPVYGGVIDVFYKLKTLSELGIQIYLHTFEYGTGKQSELEKYCKKIYYYKRSSVIINIFSRIPYIVNSRKNMDLIKNLKSIKCPILFEGLHTTYPLWKDSFKDQKILIRTHNIEHKYYLGLAKSEKNISKKLFFYSEVWKLLNFEKILSKSNFILTIAPFEHKYFNKKYPGKTKYIPVFHENTKVRSPSKKGYFALYHGDLRVSDNIRAAMFIVDFFKDIDYSLIIASNIMNIKLNKIIEKENNTSFFHLTNKTQLKDLFSRAHINILPTFQKTGIKLKLINTLYNGRFCLVNNQMVDNTGLEELCVIAKDINDFKKQILFLAEKEYPEKNIKKRKTYLQTFNNKINAKKIIDLIS